MNSRNQKSVITILFVLAALAYGWIGTNESPPAEVQAELSNVTVFELHRRRSSGEMAYLQGRIVKILPDDNDGSRHQRFIVDLDRKLTVLVAHNIDLAPRVPLKINEDIELFGQYEWNEKGGVMHWTHRDPQGTHAAGWIKYRDRVYQ